MASIPTHNQFYTSSRTGERSPQTGGEIVTITFTMPQGPSIDVVKDTRPARWRVSETEAAHRPLGHSKLTTLLGLVLDERKTLADQAPAPAELPGLYRPTEQKEYAYQGYYALVEFAQSIGYKGKAAKPGGDQDEGPLDEYLEANGYVVTEDGEPPELTGPIVKPKPEPKPEPKRKPACEGGFCNCCPKPTAPVEAAPEVSPSEFDPCPELAAAELPGGVRTRAQELGELNDERNMLINELRLAKEAIRLSKEETTRIVIQAQLDAEGLEAQVEQLKAQAKAQSETRAREEEAKRARASKTELTVLLVESMTGAIMSQELPGEEAQELWIEHYRRLTQETEEHTGRLTEEVRRVAHRLFRGCIKQG